MPLGLVALALGGFGIGLTEFVIMGLLPEVATDFGVSEVTAGWLITGYALGVVVGALGLTAAVTRLPRRTALMGLLVLFVVGNLTSALAPTYEVMLAGRVVAALCHGAFFGIGSVVAAGLVAPERKAGAIAIMFTGLTLANVLGVPFGTFLGQQLGWRSTFYAISAIGVVALVGIALLVRLPVEQEAPSLRRELGAFRARQVWWSLVLTVLGFGGMFGAFSYIAYTLTEVSGFASSSIPWLLVLMGLGLLVGNLVGGRAADRNLPRTLLVTLAGLTVVLAAFAAGADSRPAALAGLFLLGGVGFATVPALQMRVMSYAPDAPTMASSANIAAFNLGNALGAWLGGLTIGAGLGFTSPLWVGSALAGLATVVMLVATADARRSASPSPILEGALS
ncbi:MFS transporter [Aeromicrobium sp. Root495]|uniref:MFS transporter n=1 Tax=Aeromicrobium sp. Root495 TaxID=1736550 RepID=UPI0007012DB1|nr:MFS transporter [Aeromicrobium sp. Root495]KQY60317.1 MFS transporter [Aeromicrobium sp. Root495]